MKPRIFSGIQPTGVLHIGNYLGAILNWVQLQDRYDCIFSIVDLHAITTPYEPAALARATVQAANVYLAAGIDPDKSAIFVQSHVHEHAELTWLLNSIATMGELGRMTQFKDKAGVRAESVSAGLFDYPVLMAADILLYQTQIVPVGADQKQHVELARDIAVRFNGRFGPAFVVPEARIGPTGARIMGLDDPAKKMSKTAASAYNYISLTDDDDTIRRKIAKAVTDSGTQVKSGPDRPALTNLINIYSLFSGRPAADIEDAYAGQGYASFKKGLSETIIRALKPFRARLAELNADPDRVKETLARGAAAVAPIAAGTLADVKGKMGLLTE